MIKNIVISILLFILALSIGFLWAIVDINKWKSDENALKIGPWRTLSSDKDVDDDLLNIAQIAVFATYPLKKSEVIYLTAVRDSDGNVLSAENNYLIEGRKLDARYWSIVAYDENGFLIDNEADINAYNLENVAYEPDGESFKIYLSNTKTATNWLPTGNAKQLTLAIRLYHPSGTLRENLQKTLFPTIRKI